MPPAFDRELALATDIARQAGTIIMRHYAGVTVASETKDDGSPVSRADLDANLAILAGLRVGFPGDGVLSEESPDDGSRLTKNRVWIVDPLDGTRDFLGRTGDFCVHIGLAVAGRAVLGVVYHPVTRAVYRAVSGQGAFCDTEGGSRRLQVSDRDEIASFRIGTSRYNFPAAMELCLRENGMFDRAIRSGASVKYLALARGDLDAVLTISGGEKEWDTCAPGVVVTEAGGTITDGDGHPLSYNRPVIARARGMVISNGRRHADLVARLGPYQPAP